MFESLTRSVGPVADACEPDVSASLEAVEPGPDLARLLGGLRPEDLSGYDLVSYLGATERQTAWTQACQLMAIRELARRRPSPVDPGGPSSRLPDDKVSEFAADEVAAELRISRTGAEARLALSLDLDRLPRTRSLFKAGRIDLTKTRAVSEAIAGLDDETAAVVEARVADRAPEQTAAALRAALRRAVLAVDPRGAQERHDYEMAQRRVVLTPMGNGMAEIWALLPADKAMALYTAVTSLADQAKAPGDSRGIDARRADVLGDLAWRVLEREDLPRRRGRRPHVQVTVAATTLLGLDDDPGELAGYGPIPAEMARALARDGTWRRLVTDPVTGHLLDYGTTTYRAPADLDGFVGARDKTCRGVGCRQPEWRCDRDHAIPFPEGPTAAHNLGCKCRHCHRLKTLAGWRDVQHPDGSHTWITPTGHTYFVPAEPVLGLPPPAPPCADDQTDNADGETASDPDIPPF